MSVMLILNFLPDTKDSPNFVTIMFFDTIFVEITGGAVDSTPCTFTKEDSLNWKSPEIMNFMIEAAVGHCTPMVISKSRFEVNVPGKFWVRSLIELTLRMLFCLYSKYTCPKFQFSSSINPVPEMVYISIFEVIEPMAGRTLFVKI